MSQLKWLPLGLFLAWVLAASGCGSKPPGNTVIRGTVWFRGAPLPGGMIVFAPDVERGNSGPLAKATIAADGTFTLAPETTPGWYRVAIAPLPSDGVPGPTPANPYPTAPGRYRNPQLSGLQGEIKASVDNAFEFHLEDS